MQKRLLSTREFCAEYGISRTWLYNQFKVGSGPNRVQYGGRMKIDRQDAEAWLESLKVTR